MIWLMSKMWLSERRSDVSPHMIGQRPSGAASVWALRPWLCFHLKKMGQKGHSYISPVKGLAGVCLINDVAHARTGQATAHGAYPL